MDFFDEINSLGYLYLLSIDDSQCNDLVLVIKEAAVSNDVEPISIDGKSFGSGRSIRLDSPGRCYRVKFKGYAAYQITNETFATYVDSAEREGRLYCLFSGSRYLTYVSETTHAGYMYQQPLKHFSFSCANHTIDVIAGEGPEIERYTAR